MQTAQGTMLESLRSVSTFLDAHADQLGDVVKTGARQKLTEAIAVLDLHASDQTGGALASQGATQRKASLRQALLRDHDGEDRTHRRSRSPQRAGARAAPHAAGETDRGEARRGRIRYGQDCGAIRRRVHLGGTTAGLHHPAHRGDRRHDRSDQRAHVEHRSSKRPHRRARGAARRRPQDR